MEKGEDRQVDVGVTASLASLEKCASQTIEESRKQIISVMYLLVRSTERCDES